MESRAKNPQRLEAYSFPIRLFAIGLWSLTQFKEHKTVLSTNNTVTSIRASGPGMKKGEICCTFNILYNQR